MFVHYFQIITNFLFVCQSFSLLTSLLKLGNIGISPVLDEIFFWFFLDIHGTLIHWVILCLSELTYWPLSFLYVCQSVSWLTSWLKLGHYRDISFSGWDIFLKFDGHIPEIFLCYFKIIIIFLYICQSVSWLTSLLSLDKYRDISSTGWGIFFKFLQTFLGCWYTSSKYFQISCISVSLFVGFFCRQGCWHTSSK